MDSPWDEDVDHSVTRDVEWTNISSEFTTVGYREGITTGKESALQEGFDRGFADVGAPLGRELGLLRGQSSALLAYLTSPTLLRDTPEREFLVSEARDIAMKLSHVRFTDIVPPDLEVEEHTGQHLDSEDSEMEVNDEIVDKREIEELEDMVARMTAGSSTALNDKGRLTRDDVEKLKERLKALSLQLGLGINSS